jgi:uncharacterized protein YcfJ
MMTIAGTVLRGSIGYDTARRALMASARPTTQRRCRSKTAYHEQERACYQMTYRYQGREFTKRLEHSPGNPCN